MAAGVSELKEGLAVKLLGRPRPPLHHRCYGGLRILLGHLVFVAIGGRSGGSDRS